LQLSDESSLYLSDTLSGQEDSLSKKGKPPQEIP